MTLVSVLGFKIQIVIHPAQKGEVKMQKGSENTCHRNKRKPCKNTS